MAADLVQFPAPQVERHAGTVDRVSDAMQTARSAVQEVTMDVDAYGQLCQFLPGILSPVFGMGVDALNSTIDALQETATKLRTTAATTQGTDVASGERVARAGNSTGPAIQLPL
jgi:hypothetical protein